MIVIVDSDGLIGLSNEEDLHFSEASTISEKLAHAKAQLIYPATTIAEATAVLQIRLDKQDTANQILEFAKSGAFDIEPVDQAILEQAIGLMETDRNKHATLFDAIVAIVAQKYHADAIFSFDKFYQQKGFKLASELVL